MIARYSELLCDLMSNEQTSEKLNKALSTYPLYNPKKAYDLIPDRAELNKRLLNNYKYREIGFETVGRFLDELEITMCAIMPYYNEMFKTIEIMADLENPFDNVDVTETFRETRTDKASSEADSTTTTEGSSSQSDSSETTNTSSGSSQGSSTNKEDSSRKFSDTPQNNITDIDNYLTDYTKEDKNQNQTNESTTTNTESSSNDYESAATTSNEAISSSSGSSEAEGTTEHTLTRKGNQGVNTYAHDMNEFRTSIIDVVDQIINDKRIQELFMLVY